MTSFLPQEAKFGPAATVHSTESNQFSPVSILEASFSNESCSFGSLDASSGTKNLPLYTLALLLVLLRSFYIWWEKARSLLSYKLWN